MNRAYTIAEIDRMRRMLRSRELPGRHNNNGTEFNAECEDQLRTYLTAGIAPWDMEAQVSHLNTWMQAYWGAKTPEQEKVAYAQLKELGFPPAYGEAANG